MSSYNAKNLCEDAPALFDKYLVKEIEFLIFRIFYHKHNNERLVQYTLELSRWYTKLLGGRKKT